MPSINYLLPFALLLSSSLALAEVTPIPLALGDKPSPTVKVEIDGKSIPVGIVEPLGVGYCHFEISEPTLVTVITGEPRDKDLPLATTDLARYTAARPDPKSNSWQFTMKPDTKVYIKNKRTFISASSPVKEIPDPKSPSVINIADRGVTPSDTASATAAIQKALDDASATGKKTVYIPPGTYIGGTLFMRDNVTLYLAPGALLQGSEDPAEWKHQPGPQYLGYSAFLFFGHKTDDGKFVGVKNAHLKGLGTIDGHGHFFRRDTIDGKKGNNPYYYEGDTTKRARLIMALKAENCSVSGVTLRNPTFWTTHIIASDKFHFADVKVYSNFRINNDGLNFDSCTNSSIDNSVMITGDDSHCLKNEYTDGLGGPNKNIRVANSIMTGFGKGVKFGWAFHQAHDITYDNILLVNSNFGMDVGVKPIRATGPKIAEITNITIKNSVLDNGLSMSVGKNIDGYKLENIRIENTTLGSLKIKNATNLTLLNVTLKDKPLATPADLPPDSLTDCTNVTITPK